MSGQPDPRRGDGRLSLQSLLTRLIWLCVGPLILLAAYLAVSSVLTKQSERDLEAVNMANNFAAVIDQHLNARIGALHMLAESPLLDNPSRWKDLYREAQGFHHNFGSHVVLADLQMHMLFHTHVPLGTKLSMLPRPKGNAAAPAAVETGKPSIGDIFYGPIAKEPLVAIAVPAKRDGKTTYLLITIFTTHQFQERLDQVHLPSGWSLSLVDGNRAAIAKRVPPDLNPATDVEPSGRFVVKSMVSPWSVVLEIPRSVYRQPLIVAGAGLAVAILGATLLALLGGKLVGRRLARSVTSLAETQVPGTPLPEITEIAAVRRLIDETSKRREAAEEARAESERRFRATFEQAAVGIAQVSTDGRWMQVNQKLADIVGYSREELLTMRFQDMTHPDDLAADVTRVNEMLAGAISTKTVEKRYICKDGTVVWTEITVALVRKTDGTPDYLISVIKDIQSAKRVEAELREGEERYRLIAENTSDVIWLVDAATGRFTFVSPSVERLRGFKPDEILGKTIDQDLLPESFRSITGALSGRITRLQAGDESQRTEIGEFEQLCKDGSMVSTEVVTTLIMDGKGRRP